MNLTKIAKKVRELGEEHREYVANEEWKKHLHSLKIPKIKL